MSAQVVPIGRARRPKAADAHPVGINVVLDHDDRPGIRYLQCGVQTDRGFTGHVVDYVGGGCWQDFHLLHGEIIEDDGEFGGEDCLFEIGQAFPGLPEEIERWETALMSYDDEYRPRPTAFLRLATAALPETEVYSDGHRIDPVSVGNTVFRQDAETSHA